MAEPSVTGLETIYKDGTLEVDLFSVRSNSSSALKWWKKRKKEGKLAGDSPPPLLIATPKQAGEFPVVVLQHGFLLKNVFYSQLMNHVSSHGFIVVAPQMYNFVGSDANDEIQAAAAVVDWLPQGLAEEISKRLDGTTALKPKPENLVQPNSEKLVKPNLEKVALVGHSRGGKVACGLCISPTSQKISAIACLDPVDGSGKDGQTNPPILKFSQNSMNLGMPTLVVGARLGSVRKKVLFLPLPLCDPEGVCHDDFFYESSPPSFHFVATDYGHMDFLDDNIRGVRGWVSYRICENGEGREPMRRFSAGIIVAFLRAFLLNDRSQLDATIDDHSLAPVTLEDIETKQLP